MFHTISCICKCERKKKFKNTTIIQLQKLHDASDYRHNNRISVHTKITSLCYIKIIKTQYLKTWKAIKTILENLKGSIVHSFFKDTNNHLLKSIKIQKLDRHICTVKTTADAEHHSSHIFFEYLLLKMFMGGTKP